MNERGWFTLMVRGIGLTFAGMGLYGAASLLFMAVLQLLSPWWPASYAQSGRFDNWSYVLYSSIGPLVTLAMGLYLVFRADWLIARFCREVVGRCARCGYDTSGLTSGQCPECQAPLARPAENP